MSERDKLPRWVLWLGLAVAGAWLLYTLRGVLAPVFFAFLIAYMLDPLVDRIEQSRLLKGRSYGRAVGIAVILAGFFVITVVGVIVIVHRADGVRGSRELPQAVAGASRTQSCRMGADSRGIRPRDPDLSRSGLRRPTPGRPVGGGTGLRAVHRGTEVFSWRNRNRGRWDRRIGDDSRLCILLVV